MRLLFIPLAVHHTAYCHVSAKWKLNKNNPANSSYILQITFTVCTHICTHTVNVILNPHLIELHLRSTGKKDTPRGTITPPLHHHDCNLWQMRNRRRMLSPARADILQRNPVHAEADSSWPSSIGLPDG